MMYCIFELCRGKAMFIRLLCRPDEPSWSGVGPNNKKRTRPVRSLKQQNGVCVCV